MDSKVHLQVSPCLLLRWHAYLVLVSAPEGTHRFNARSRASVTSASHTTGQEPMSPGDRFRGSIIARSSDFHRFFKRNISNGRLPRRGTHQRRRPAVGLLRLRLPPFELAEQQRMPSARSFVLTFILRSATALPCGPRSNTTSALALDFEQATRVRDRS